ncbi:MAG: HAMP domain-containing histidine kinase [Candidatus Thiodiazotropha sp. (ex Lucinoma kastoroae)]|nr:HAMP domain-containing histidine kinase [Candidatus Thiodiazotropha sp. (ex Lucinoma kastoroae)]
MPLAIAQTLDGVKRVTQIVHSMKEFSHSGSDHKEVVDINHAIESTIVVSRNEWKYDADMITDFDEALTAVPCYPGEFNQMILNMIVNAAHAIKDAKGDGEQQGVITVSTSVAAEYAEIRIKDTGTGMAKEVRKHIFESFFTTKEVGKGSGQGLAIAYAVVVEKHGGAIDVVSESGQGTTFIIRLPMTG